MRSIGVGFGEVFAGVDEGGTDGGVSDTFFMGQDVCDRPVGRAADSNPATEPVSEPEPTEDPGDVVDPALVRRDNSDDVNVETEVDVDCIIDSICEDTVEVLGANIDPVSLKVMTAIDENVLPGMKTMIDPAAILVELGVPPTSPVVNWTDEKGRTDAALAALTLMLSRNIHPDVFAHAYRMLQPLFRT